MQAIVGWGILTMLAVGVICLNIASYRRGENLPTLTKEQQREADIYWWQQIGF